MKNKKTKLFMLFLFFMLPSLYGQNLYFPEYRRQAALIASAMDDSALAAQVLITGIEGRYSLSPAMRTLLQRIPAGAVMLFGYNLDTSKDAIKSLLEETVNLITANSQIAPFIAVDHEGGRVHRFGDIVQPLPSAYSFWHLAQRAGSGFAIREAENLYRRSAEEISALGINMVFAPVAEILYDENSWFLGDRSYGPDIYFAEAAASSYIRAMYAHGIASVLKHFPGNTSVDPHLWVSSLNLDRAALNHIVRPFAAIINELSPSAVMVSHVIVPALDSSINASLSQAVIQDWLRMELGFNGIVIADDLSMGAIEVIDPIVAAIYALNAGVDMIMVWPHNINAVHRAILGALQNGSLSRQRLMQAVENIITEKLRYGLITF